MKILPPQTRPPQAPTFRRHQPQPAGRFAAYRACLRWDFGFTCPFCLLHEADLYGGLPGEGLGATTVEHRVLRRDDASRQNDYENCLYACRLCNRSRSVLPLTESGAYLLDPTASAWGAHFECETDLLRPFDGDPDAAYTHRAYELDDPRKVLRRRVRRELVSDRTLLLEDLRVELATLQERLNASQGQESRASLLDQLERIRSDARRALADLERYLALPVDAPQSCRCQSSRYHSLPDELERQLVEVLASGL